MAMEFWGVEVKAGESLKVSPEEGKILHLSQAALGEVKKDKNESVLLSVNVDDKKIVLGTLSATGCPQIAYDLIFEKSFELSHNWKNGSVHFIGYMAEVQEDESEDEKMGFEEESDSEEEELPVAAADNGKADEVKTEKAKAPTEKAKAVKPENAAVKKGKDAKPEEDSDDSDDSDNSEDDDSDDEDMLPADIDSDDSDEDDSSEEEEDTPTPKNAKQGKKRAAEEKTPVPEKKAKLVTPQKSGGDGKKGASTHTATPHPKKGAKTAEKSGAKPQTPKSAGSVTCKTCSKSFNSDGALQSHTKAKHSDAK